MKNLLLIEDDPNTLSGLQDLLRQEGYGVFGVTRGRLALQSIFRESFDIVICDYSLPDMDGLQVCRELRWLRPELRFFLVTAYSNSEIIKAARECRITRVFHKPLDLDELLAGLATLPTWVKPGQHVYARA